MPQQLLLQYVISANILRGFLGTGAKTARIYNISTSSTLLKNRFFLVVTSGQYIFASAEFGCCDFCVVERLSSGDDYLEKRCTKTFHADWKWCQWLHRFTKTEFHIYHYLIYCKAFNWRTFFHCTSQFLRPHWSPQPFHCILFNRNTEASMKSLSNLNSMRIVFFQPQWKFITNFCPKTRKSKNPKGSKVKVRIRFLFISIFFLDKFRKKFD